VFLKGHWKQDTFVTNYLPLALFPILYLGAKFLKERAPIVRAQDMDFITNIAEIEADVCVGPLVLSLPFFASDRVPFVFLARDRYDEPPPKNKMEAVWAWLVCAVFSLFSSSFADGRCRCKEKESTCYIQYAEANRGIVSSSSRSRRFSFLFSTYELSGVMTRDIAALCSWRFVVVWLRYKRHHTVSDNHAST
jgi:hypothetical protein